MSKQIEHSIKILIFLCINSKYYLDNQNVNGTVINTTIKKTLAISSGSIEALKWSGMLFMTIDHANRIFFNQQFYQAYCAGRLAMPLFAFVFAYNLARVEPISLEMYNKTLMRLIFFGVLATPAYIAMNHIQRWFPLNILFAFLIVLSMLYLYDKGKWSLSICIFLIGGIFVEYSWSVLLLCASFWLFSKKPSVIAILPGLAGYSLLYILNDNNWGLAALPIIFLATQVDLKIPRWHYFFWIYYPAHMTLFYLIYKFI